MPDLTDADLEAMEKRCEKELEGPWPHVIYPAHARSDVPALIAALREARAERDEAEKRYVEQLERADAAVGDRDHRVAALQAENRLLRDLLARVVDGDDVISEAAVVLYSDDGKAIALTAAEVARVQRLEKVAEAARKAEYPPACLCCDYGIDVAPCTCTDVIQLREDVKAALAELDAGGESCP